MKTTTAFAIIICLLSGCKKTITEKPTEDLPLMHYINLNNITAGRQQPVSIDVDANGVKDISFSFLLVGDPITKQDKQQYYITGPFNTYFAINIDEQSPMLNKNDAIGLASFPQHEWYNAPSILLAQKVISNTNPPYWEGKWKNASNVYFPFFIKKNEARYFGWIHFTFDMTNERVIIHSAAVSTKPEKAVKAGIK